jgi:hypothetical protein
MAGYDVCVATHGTTTFTGPILGMIGGDAGTVPFQFPAVTTYIASIDPGQYDIEIVASGASDCTTPVGSAITNLPTLAANDFYTYAIVGDTTAAGSDATLTVVGFQDDAAPTNGSANVRFLNVAPSLSGSTTVDFGQGSFAVTPFNPLETAVGFGVVPTENANDSDAGTVDSAGYLQLPAITSDTQFSARLTTGATADIATASSQTLPANTSNTLVLINGKQGNAATFLVCTGDATTSSTSLLSSCTQVAH